MPITKNTVLCTLRYVKRTDFMLNVLTTPKKRKSTREDDQSRNALELGGPGGILGGWVGVGMPTDITA